MYKEVKKVSFMFLLCSFSTVGLFSNEIDTPSKEMPIKSRGFSPLFSADEIAFFDALKANQKEMHKKNAARKKEVERISERPCFKTPEYVEAN